MDKVSYSKMFAVVFSAIIAAFAVILLLYVFSLEAQQEIYEEQLELINKSVTIDAIKIPTSGLSANKSQRHTEQSTTESFQPDLMCKKYLDAYAKNPTSENRNIVSQVCGIYKDRN
ncbi:hypothetical protein [Pseudoalteromonas ruthenica]|uniref:hypothetical protein n=1 Tax=Pseudoalteromonas ruthenica TaxID=151081 RepID=UPI00241FD56E|nr:hypothetical protein [Pseudoalteromonas ruthenica]|tara:strand:+ start:16466 stop:16813 length:348 start_codon:yes stop_codon:yes gene_type:complete